MGEKVNYDPVTAPVPGVNESLSKEEKGKLFPETEQPLIQPVKKEKKVIFSRFGIKISR